MDTTTASAQPRKPGMLINRNFGLLLGGQTISFFGDLMLTTTLVIWIAKGLTANLSWSPVAVSGVLVATAAPTLFVGLFAGVFVDRANKRRLILWMDALRTVIVALLALGAGAFPLPFVPGGALPLFWTLGAIFAVVILVNVGEQFFRPSQMALIQDIVPAEHQAQAMGTMQAASSLAVILGPSVAAPLYAAYGPIWAILIDAATFAISFLLVLAIRMSRAGALSPVAGAPASAPRAGFWSELGAGFRFYFSNRVLVTLLVSVVIAMAGAGALNTLDIFFATQNLHASTAMYGFIGGVMGLGTIVGAIVIGMLAQRVGLARTLWLSMFAFGIVVIVLSRVTSYEIALAIFAVTGVLNAGLNTAFAPIMMRETPQDMMGRVMSIFMPSLNVGLLASTAIIGYLAGVAMRNFHEVVFGWTFETIDTIWLVGGVLMALSGLMIMVGLRGVDRRYRREDREKVVAAAAQTEPLAEVTTA